MRPRVALGDFFIRIGSFIQSLAIMIMRPYDLLEFNRRTYTRPNTIESWGSDSIVDLKLYPEENFLLNKLPLKRGRLLLLGLGGGREAIAISKSGFQVEGVDFIPDLVKKAQENALKRGVKISGLVQEISQLDVPPSSYDVVWLTSSGLYSSFPTRKMRICMLGKIRKALVPGGYLICQFYVNMRIYSSPLKETLKKAFAFLTLGNFAYEKGDMLLDNLEFVHVFSSVEEVMSEFEEGKFEIVLTKIPKDDIRGGAILRKELIDSDIKRN